MVGLQGTAEGWQVEWMRPKANRSRQGGKHRRKGKGRHRGGGGGRRGGGGGGGRRGGGGGGGGGSGGGGGDGGGSNFAADADDDDDDDDDDEYADDFDDDDADNEPEVLDGVLARALDDGAATDGVGSALTAMSEFVSSSAEWSAFVNGFQLQVSVQAILIAEHGAH